MAADTEGQLWAAAASPAPPGAIPALRCGERPPAPQPRARPGNSSDGSALPCPSAESPSRAQQRWLCPVLPCPHRDGSVLSCPILPAPGSQRKFPLPGTSLGLPDGERPLTPSRAGRPWRGWARLKPAPVSGPFLPGSILAFNLLRNQPYSGSEGLSLCRGASSVFDEVTLAGVQLLHPTRAAAPTRPAGAFPIILQRAALRKRPSLRDVTDTILDSSQGISIHLVAGFQGKQNVVPQKNSQIHPCGRCICKEQDCD
ncbi:uncharacterized protein LOC120507908 [Passer montanus]|uniref:uncharacterized protein LOC120507908 n=1 Tax=Passer montanus TaxID=9160 RepID=UPI0019620F65|nr:uncharacterized protein LOC120507908 [Passer montanus]